jgi:hypothetical protein
MGGISIDKVRAGRDKSISYSIIFKRETVKRGSRVVLTDQQYIISKILGIVMFVFSCAYKQSFDSFWYNDGFS